MDSLFFGTDVIELNDNDFDLSQKKHPKLKMPDPGLIMFYSARCPHCIVKKDPYQKLGSMFNREPGFQIYSVHVVDPESQKISRDLSITSIPTFYEADKRGELIEAPEKYVELSEALEEMEEDLTDEEDPRITELTEEMYQITDYTETDEDTEFTETDEDTEFTEGTG